MTFNQKAKVCFIYSYQELSLGHLSFFRSTGLQALVTLKGELELKTPVDSVRCKAIEISGRATKRPFDFQ